MMRHQKHGLEWHSQQPPGAEESRNTSSPGAPEGTSSVKCLDVSLRNSCWISDVQNSRITCGVSIH